MTGWLNFLPPAPKSWLEDEDFRAALGLGFLIGIVLGVSLLAWW